MNMTNKIYECTDEQFVELIKICAAKKIIKIEHSIKRRKLSNEKSYITPNKNDVVNNKINIAIGNRYKRLRLFNLHISLFLWYAYDCDSLSLNSNILNIENKRK